MLHPVEVTTYAPPIEPLDGIDVPGRATLRQISFRIPVHDYRKYTFAWVGVPIPTPHLAEDLEALGLPSIGWLDDDLFMAMIPLVWRVRQPGIRGYGQVVFSLTGGAARIGSESDPGATLTPRQQEQLSTVTRSYVPQLFDKMTLRGRPHEGRAAARERLLKAAMHLDQKHREISRPGLADALGIGRRGPVSGGHVRTVDGVADLLSRADWTLKDLKAEVLRRKGE